MSPAILSPPNQRLAPSAGEGRASGDAPAAASLFGRDVLLAILPPEQRLASLAGRDVPLAILPQPPRRWGDVLLKILAPWAAPGLVGRRDVPPAILPWPPRRSGRGVLLAILEGRAAGNSPAAASSFWKDVLLAVLLPKQRLAWDPPA